MRFLWFFALPIAAVPFVTLARDYSASWGYADSVPDRETAIGVTVLTQEGVLEGNPDGTFRPYNLVNRAEFMKIAMKLSPEGAGTYPSGCFPDVPFGVWFESFVCRAKELGIVHGNALPGLSKDEWPFQPARSVQYEEVLKVFVNIFQLPVSADEGEWYVPFLRAAEQHGLVLPSLRPGHRLMRGELARLAAAFLAYSEGELDLLRSAEEGEVLLPLFSSHASSSSFASFASFASSQSNVRYDELSDTDVRSQFLLLGQVSPMLAKVRIFHDDEPFTVTEVAVDLTQSVRSVEALFVYDEDRRYLGRANLDNSVGTGLRYTLTLSSGTLDIPKRENVSIYVRAMMKDKDSGGVGGEHVQVDDFTVTGDGIWSNSTVTTTSSETFLPFQTARARITDVRNADTAEGTIPFGSNQLVGFFEFLSERSDNSAEISVGDLVFTVSATNDLTLTNFTLQGDGAGDMHSCSLSSTTLTCASIPLSHGTLGTVGKRRVRIFADVSTDSTVTNPSLQLSLNGAGTLTSTGSVTWTDGTSDYSWVEDGTPVARGMVMK